MNPLKHIVVWLLGGSDPSRTLLPLIEDSGEDEHHIDFQDDPFLWITYFCICIGLVTMAGLMSGLTLGLMSLDTVELEVLKRTGSEEEKRYASIIMPVIKNQHLLLVTLLLCNACATEALPLFIDRLADPITAVLMSVTVVLIFGEVIPQAVCSRYGLLVGAYSSWFVTTLMTMTLPIAWPIAKLLDLTLGSAHGALFRHAQLKALVHVHASDAGFGGTLTQDEIHIISGALDMTHKTAMKSMTPLDKLFMLSTDDRLDERCLQAVLQSGHSRIPVYRGGNRKDIVGLILAKELVLVNPLDAISLDEMRHRHLPVIPADTPMYDMLRLFKTGKSHMALLVKPQVEMSSLGRAPASRAASIRRLQSSRRSSRYRASNDTSGLEDTSDVDKNLDEPIGIITIEDVIEELLQEEIVDETDMYVDNLQTSRVSGPKIVGCLPPRLRVMLNAGAFTPRIGRLGMPVLPVPSSEEHVVVVEHVQPSKSKRRMPISASAPYILASDEADPIGCSDSKRVGDIEDPKA